MATTRVLAADETGRSKFKDTARGRAIAGRLQELLLDAWPAESGRKRAKKIPGINRTTLQNYMAGQTLPEIAQLTALVDAGASIDHLLTGRGGRYLDGNAPTRSTADLLHGYVVARVAQEMGRDAEEVRKRIADPETLLRNVLQTSKQTVEILDSVSLLAGLESGDVAMTTTVGISAHAAGHSSKVSGRVSGRNSPRRAETHRN